MKNSTLQRTITAFLLILSTTSGSLFAMEAADAASIAGMAGDGFEMFRQLL